MFKTTGAVCALLMLMSGVAWAGERVELTLIDGRRVRGEVLSREGGKVRIKVSKTETLILPASLIRSTRALAPEKGAEGASGEKTLPVPQVRLPKEEPLPKDAVTRAPETFGDTLVRSSVEVLGGGAAGLIGLGLGAAAGAGMACGFDFGSSCLAASNSDRLNTGLVLGGLVGYATGATVSVWKIGEAFGAKGSYVGALLGFAGGAVVMFGVLANTNDLTVLALPALTTVIGYEISHFGTPVAPKASAWNLSIVPRDSGAQLHLSLTF